MSVSHGAAEWLWLLLGFVVAATNPALRQVRADGGSIIGGTIVVAVVMLLGLVALLSFNGGYLTLPSFSLAIIAGYVGFGTPLPATVLAVLFVLRVVPLEPVLWAVALIAASSWITGWWSARRSRKAPAEATRQAADV